MAAEISKPNGAGIVTTWEPIESNDDLLNPDLVKVVLDDNENAVYFSRSPIPYPRDAVKRHGSPEAALTNEPELLKLFRKHTGLYVYRRDVLLEFTKWPQSQLEKIEALEQLRALEHGVKIKVVEACSASTGVDTVEDLERVRALDRNFAVNSDVPKSMSDWIGLAVIGFVDLVRAVWLIAPEQTLRCLDRRIRKTRTGRTGSARRRTGRTAESTRSIEGKSSRGAWKT